jgi:hypothetical protein
MSEPLNSSQTSGSSVVHLPSNYESLSLNPQELYHFNVQFDSYQNLKSILSDYSTFWFSWSILDMTIQTAIHEVKYPEASQESLTIQCSAPALSKFLTDLSSFRVYLCVPNKILSYFEILFPKDLTLPLQFSRWFPFVSSDNPAPTSSPSSASSVHVTIQVNKSVKEKKIGFQMNQGIQVAEDLDNNHPEDENYSDDGESTTDHDHHPKPDHVREEREAEEENDTESEYDASRYRLSFQIRSVRNLKRAAHISLQFAYPHLGVSSSPIRTHGSWCVAHSETLIESAIASYEFQMIPSQLLTILQHNQLIVNVISRTHLGTDRVGDATIDLKNLYMNSPSSSSVTILYRCPLTGKQFKSIEQYHRHRQTMIALYTLGRINEVPSKIPIIIRSIDTLAPILGKIPSQTKSNPEIVGKLRCLLILEQMGRVDTTSSIHKDPSSDPLLVTPPAPPPPPPFSSTSPSPTHEEATGETEVLRRLNWEEWRRHEEEKWMNSLREKEIKLRQQLEIEMTKNLSQKADDLHRAQEEVGRLEVRLRISIETIEKQKLQLQLKEEQINIRLAQKTEELNLLQKRIRDEGKNKIEQEIRRNKSLELHINTLQETIQRVEKRANDIEKDYENYRQYIRSIPEIQLREEISRHKSINSELRNEIEREKRIRSEMELEKEHYRSQCQRVAMALKRERDKNSVMARQELEQLRLEFLAREERYVLDGDRDELRTIREELSQIRTGGGGGGSSHHHYGRGSSSVLPMSNSFQHSPSPPPPSRPSQSVLPIFSPSMQHQVASDQAQIERLKQMRQELLKSNLYEPSDSVIQEIDEAIAQQQIQLTRTVDGVLEQKSS